MELTKDLAYSELQQILRDKVLLVVGTGASMALDHRFGMEALSSELLKKIPGRINGSDEAKKQWEVVAKKLEEGIDLESALKETNDKFLIKKIVRVSGDFLAKLDKKYKLQILNDELEVPVGHFITKLTNGLPESGPVLDIITLNYDLLIEHCCDQLKIAYTTGFVGGIRKYPDWNKAEKQMVYKKIIPRGKKKLKVKRIHRHLRLYKVHGSLNWFKKNDDKIEDNSLVYSNLGASAMERFIITPGNSKYRRAFDNFDCFKRVDDVVPLNKAFIFIGYGFNDEHLQKRIKKELLEKKKQGIIITKQLSPNAEKFLHESDKLWAIYHSSDKYGDVDEEDTLIYNRAFERPLIIRNQSIWDVKNFSKEVLGE